MAQDHKTCAAEMTIGAFSKGNAILVDEHLRVCTLPLHLMPQDAELGNVIEVSVRINKKKQRAKMVSLKNSIDDVGAFLEEMANSERKLSNKGKLASNGHATADVE
ncbi:hypothetical protein AAMO2058_001562500 [Amorphochlora amoebiformis]|mmetsp:Transcript_21976/g.34610  ORF Transcript_21976/g.34610 Transcript_21976/m.34610 type:complete len:106 (-) Transcript_21976:93-410(-)